eukprot:454065-Rhodomonas_salina.1
MRDTQAGVENGESGACDVRCVAREGSRRVIVRSPYIVGEFLLPSRWKQMAGRAGAPPATRPSLV